MKNYFFSILLFSFFAASCGEGLENDLGKLPVGDETSENNGGNESSEEDDEVVVDPNAKVVTVDLNSICGPEINIKRGGTGPGMNGFFYDEKAVNFFDEYGKYGFDIFNCYRNLVSDQEKGEFFKNPDGSIGTQICEDYIKLKQYAIGKNLELVSQCMGLYNDEELFEFQTNYERPEGGTNMDEGKYAPLPVEEDMEKAQKSFVEWAIKSDDAISPGYRSIWIGTQEPSHTLGFIPGQKDVRHNIDRYIDYWKPIADGLRNAGAKVGGIQLNSANLDDFMYAAKQMVKKNLELDFMTFQLYQWGDTIELRKALNALKEYNKTYPDAKIYVNRGDYTKPLEKLGIDPNSSKGFINFLVQEKMCIDNADKIYAYTLDRSFNGFSDVVNDLNWQTRFFLNKLGNKRIPLTNLPVNMNGFMTKSGDKIIGIIWNRTESNNLTEKQSIRLEFENCDKDYEFKVQKASGTVLSEYKTQWNSQDKSLNGIILNPDEYVLIESK